MGRRPGSDHYTQIKQSQRMKTRSHLNHICGILSVHTFGHSCFLNFTFIEMFSLFVRRIDRHLMTEVSCKTSHVHCTLYSVHCTLYTLYISRQRSGLSICNCNGWCSPAPSQRPGTDRRRTLRRGAPRRPHRPRRR